MKPNNAYSKVNRVAIKSIKTIYCEFVNSIDF